MRVTRWRRYGAGDSVGGMAGGYEVQRPVRPPTWESDVAVPLGQSVVTGFVLGSAATVVAWYVWDLPVWPAWGVVVAVAVGGAWLWRMGAAGATLYVVERVLGADLDGDGEIGAPEAHIVTLRANGAGAPEDPEVRLRGEFVTFVRGCAAAGDTSLRRWEEAGMGRQRYEEFRDRLMGGGFARWKDPENRRQGWEITAPADVIIEHIM